MTKIYTVEKYARVACGGKDFVELTAYGPNMVKYGMQADYAQLVYCAVAFVLATVCYLRTFSSPWGKEWSRLALFAFLQGIAGLLGIFVWSMAKGYSLEPWITGCELLSYGVLAKSAWDYWTGGKPAGSRATPPWLGAFFVLVVLQCLLKLAVSTIPGIAKLILLEGVAPVTWTQAAEILLLFCMIVQCLPDTSTGTVGGLTLQRRDRLNLLLAFTALFSAGCLTTGYIARDTDEELRGYLRSRTEIAAIAMRPKLMMLFENFMVSGDRQAYHFVSPELQAVQRTNPETKGLYVIVRQGEEIIFAYSSQKEESSGNEAGRSYKQYPPELLQTFATGISTTAGPYTDEWGSFVSGFAAVRNQGGGSTAVLGLDMDAGEWIKTIFRHRLAPICITFLFFMIGIIYFINRQRLLAAMEQTTASEERFALAMQGANDGLWDWNVATGEVYFSPQWKRMLGFSPDEAETNLHQWAKLLHSEDRGEAMAQLRAYLRGRGERLEYEVRMRHRDGYYIDVLARTFAVRRVGDRRPIRVVGTQVDITEKNATARELKLAKEAAEQAAKTRSAFLANMSHEIRTPIHAILGFTQLMQQDANLTREQQDHIATIRRNGECLLAVINEVLEMSKLEATKIELHRDVFALPELLAEIGSLFQGQLQEKGLEFSCSGLEQLPRYVGADKQKLRQILVNLLGNAVKFTETGLIHVAALMETGTQNKTESRLIWEVRDSGPGIADEEQERIFQPFIQADTGTKAGGTGLGLAISREYARLMGGDIFLVSHRGKGSLFRLEAPVRIEADRSEAAPTEVDKAAETAKPSSDLSPGTATEPQEDLPAGFAAELCDAILRARIDECEVLIGCLHKTCPFMAKRLREHLRCYEYEKILTLLQNGRKNSG